MSASIKAFDFHKCGMFHRDCQDSFPICETCQAARRYDPDIKTVRVKLGDRDATISFGAKIGGVKADGKGLKFELVYFSSEPSHTLIAGLKPKEVIANGKRLPKSIEPLQRKPGWWWDDKSQRAYVTTPPANQLTQVQLLAE